MEKYTPIINPPANPEHLKEPPPVEKENQTRCDKCCECCCNCIGTCLNCCMDNCFFFSMCMFFSSR